MGIVVPNITATRSDELGPGAKPSFVSAGSLGSADGKHSDHLAPMFRFAPPKMKQLARFSASWPEE